MQRDVIKALGLISGGFFIAAATVYSLLFSLIFMISVPGSAPPDTGFGYAMILVFAVGTGAGLVIMFVSAKLARSDKRRTRVIAGSVIIIAAVFATPSTTGGFGAGIILALITGVFAITNKETQREEATMRPPPPDEYWLK